MGSPPIPDRPDPRPYSPPSRKASSIAFSPPKKRANASLKGKEKALDQNSWPGEITFRHVLGNGAGGTANPLRVVAHIDIDAAYAAMEMARLGISPDVPLAVQQWQGLIAVNYPARKFGISRHETPADAVLKCPQLIMVHCATYKQGDESPSYDNPNPLPETHKISLDYYRRESLKIIKVFSEHCPIVEKASIDESYLDLTLPVRQILLQRYPFLATLPEGAHLDTILPSPASMGVTVDWKKVGNVIPVNPVEEKVVPVEAKSEGTSLEAENGDNKVGESSSILSPPNSTPTEEEEESTELTWSDVCLAIGAEVVATCRESVSTELGYTCSAGIAPNKMLAKLCSAWKKPNAQTILRFSAVANFLRPMRFQKIRNMGGKLGNAIKESFAADTVGDLIEIPLASLQANMGGETGLWCWEIIRGIDLSEVEAKTNVKSMLSSKNFRPYIVKYGEATHWLSILSTELHLRLCEARELSPGLWPKTITFTHRSPNFVIKSHQVAFPFTSRLSIRYITDIAFKLLRTAIGETQVTLDEKSKIGPYGNIQLSFSGLEKLEVGQQGIEGFFAGNKNGAVKGVASENAIGMDKKRKLDREEGDGRRSEAKSDQRTTSEQQLPPEPPAEITPILPTWTCTRCSKPIHIPPESIIELRPLFSPSSVAAALEREKAEHVDYHFARDLHEGERNVRREELDSGPVKKKLKKKIGGVGNIKERESKSTGGQQSLKGFFSKTS